jgi:site-specific recombinase XerD
MTPSQNKSTTESLVLYEETLRGNNTSAPSIKAYMSDLRQFVGWLQTRRVDWDIPYRIERFDIVGFINKLAAEKAIAVTRRRKLAAIREFMKFCKITLQRHFDEMSPKTLSISLFSLMTLIRISGIKSP